MYKLVWARHIPQKQEKIAPINAKESKKRLGKKQSPAFLSIFLISSVVCPCCLPCCLSNFLLPTPLLPCYMYTTLMVRFSPSSRPLHQTQLPNREHPVSTLHESRRKRVSTNVGAHLSILQRNRLLHFKPATRTGAPPRKDIAAG